MSLTKYASYEVSEILDLKGSAEHRTASLDKLAEFGDYRTEDGYLYARIRAISSRVNKNFDGWPSIELAGSPEVFERHHGSGGFTVAASRQAKHGFSTFLGKPIFVDHNNSNPDRARGVIVDSKLHVEDLRTASLDAYYSSAPDNHKPPTWVELLLEVDAKSFPRLAKAIIDGAKNSHRGIDGFSMGCNVEMSKCSHCGNEATNPEEYCEHIRSKGAHFDHVDHTGRKTSKRSYEDCYGIQFFEISAVFDPADETALIREVRASVDSEQRTADSGPIGIAPQPGNGAQSPLPQADLLRAPEAVNTLRDEKTCPVCGEQGMEEECKLCGFVEEPKGFDNPDLTQAQRTDDAPPAPPEIPQADSELRDKTLPPGMPGVQPRVQGPLAHVTGMARWTVLTPKTAGRINTVERPILPGSGQATAEPQEQILSDQSKPVTSSVRTASDFIAAAGRNAGETMKTADEATPDKRVDVTGVGGVLDASNDDASKAQAQIDVEGVGGTGVEGTDPTSTESIEQTSDNAGFDTKKNIEAIPTKTFGDNGTDAVTSAPFPESGQGVKSAHDDKAYPDNDGGLGGGKANQGTTPVSETFGERENVLDHPTSPANNSGPTKTWSGTDGNGVTKQVDAVTPESIATDGFGKGSSAHLFAAFKLADLEVELGLTPADKKFDRVAELEGLEPAAVVASLDYAKRVKTAGLSKGGPVRTARRLPVMGRSAATVEPTVVEAPDHSDDSALFLP